MTYYKIIGGVRYDRRLLEAADACTKGRGEFRISLEEIQSLYQQTADGLAMTPVETETLRYIGQHYPLTDKAKTWLAEQLPSTGDDIENVIQQVLRSEYELANMQIEINKAVVQQYLAGSSTRTWKAVLRGAVEAFLHTSQGQLSLTACVARRDGMYDLMSDPTDLVKSYLDRGTLFLIPPDATLESPLPYDLPHVLDATYFWTFVLQIPDFEMVEFFAFVHREQNFQYSRGNFSRKADLERTINAAVRQFARFDRLKWNIPAEEVERQMAIIPDQNFGNALFAALAIGIYNQESSSSFGDFIRQEIWPDPAIDIQEEMHIYADRGVLHLIPLDYRAQTEAGTAAFPVPEQYSFWTDGEWVFGLEMPKKTEVRLFLTTQRDGNDGETAWNDGFIDTPLSIAEQIQKIVAEEFRLEGLQVNFQETEYVAQRQQFGPEWRTLSSILRQALNTLLHDYLSPNGMFNAVAGGHEADVDPTYFDDPKEYRAAIQHLIENYLRTDAVLDLLPYTGENVFPQGETVAENWLARAVAETLADHWFWIVLPRWLEEPQRPYNYID